MGVFRRFSGDFTNVMVPQSSTIPWSIPVDAIKFCRMGRMGSLASLDMYRTYMFPFPFHCHSITRYLSLNLMLIYFADTGI
jgi:hypothetical protein